MPNGVSGNSDRVTIKKCTKSLLRCCCYSSAQQVHYSIDYEQELCGKKLTGIVLLRVISLQCKYMKIKELGGDEKGR